MSTDVSKGENLSEVPTDEIFDALPSHFLGKVTNVDRTDIVNQLGNKGTTSYDTPCTIFICRIKRGIYCLISREKDKFFVDILRHARLGF